MARNDLSESTLGCLIGGAGPAGLGFLFNAIKRGALEQLAQAGTIIANVKYSLENLDGTKIISEGVATSTATYDRSIQRFASLRAARDAEIRLAKVLAEQIKTRIASVLVTKP